MFDYTMNRENVNRGVDKKTSRRRNRCPGLDPRLYKDRSTEQDVTRTRTNQTSVLTEGSSR